MLSRTDLTLLSTGKHYLLVPSKPVKMVVIVAMQKKKDHCQIKTGNKHLSPILKSDARKMDSRK